MVSLLFAGITLSSFDKEVMPELLTQGLQTPEGGRLLIGMLAGFIPEWWPTSNRNTRPVWIGIRTRWPKTDTTATGSVAKDATGAISQNEA